MTATDLVIEALAHDAAELEHDVALGRELLRAALDNQAATERKLLDLHERFTALREELRRYTSEKVTS